MRRQAADRPLGASVAVVAIALVVSWFLCAAGLLGPGLQYYGPADVVAVVVIYLPLLMSFCAIYGLPVWAAGLGAVYLIGRRFGSDVVAVVVAGAVGAVSGAVWIALTLPAAITPEDGPWQGGHHIWILVGATAALGRLATIPFVRSR